MAETTTTRNYCTKKHTQAEIEEASNTLRRLCPQNSRVYCFITGLSSFSTPRYELAVIVMDVSTDQATGKEVSTPRLTNITGYVHVVLGCRWYDSPNTTSGIQGQGVYYNDFVSSLADKLYNDDNALIAHRM